MPDEMWKHYRLELSVDRLVGGIPKNPDIVKRWQEARWNERKLEAGDPATPEEAAEITIEMLGEQMEAEEKGIWTGFVEAPEGGLAVESRQIKACLKESANILRTMIRVHGKTIPLRARLAERVFVVEHLLPLGVDQAQSRERPIHVMTAQGPRTALKRTDYVVDAKLSCTLKVLDDGVISETILRDILDHASLNGLGTDRSQGEGTFTYVLTALD